MCLSEVNGRRTQISFELLCYNAHFSPMFRGEQNLLRPANLNCGESNVAMLKTMLCANLLRCVNVISGVRSAHLAASNRKWRDEIFSVV